MTIDLPVWIGNFREWRIVEAEIVHIAPHMEHWTWALNRSTDGSPFWKVTNIETGCACPSESYRSSVQTIEAARQSLAKQTDESLERAVAKLPKECRT
jgi:hypothetical protein